MQAVGSILSVIGGIGSLICWILVLVKMFPAEGALKGILAIICSLYAFIWGWMNASRFNLRNIMLAWTVCIVLAVIGGAIGGATANVTFDQGSVGSNLVLFVSVIAVALGF